MPPMTLRASIQSLPVHLLDSIAQVSAEHAGAVVITGSHGGASAAHYAQAVRAALYVFNDAGVGKDRAGIAALELLDAQGIAAVTVAHDSARIGDAHDSLASGVVSHVNATAGRLRLTSGLSLRQLLATE